MTILTSEQIALKCDDIQNPRSNRTAINRLYREQDESDLWPIKGRFNVTERAIRRARAFIRDSGIEMSGLEYAYFLDSAMSEIVNNERNR